MSLWLGLRWAILLRVMAFEKDFLTLDNEHNLRGVLTAAAVACIFVNHGSQFVNASNIAHL